LKQFRGRLTNAQIAQGMTAAMMNAWRLASDASILLESKRFPSAASLAVLSIEESGKSSILRAMSVARTEKEVTDLWRDFRSHRVKLDRLDRAFVVGLATLTAVYLFLFGHYFAATMIRRPYWDMFHYIVDYLDYRRAGGFLHDLWQPYVHSEHRQIWMRLLTAIDIGAFGGIAYPFLVASTACLVAVPLLLWREIGRSGLPRDLAVGSGCVVLLLALTTANVVDCSIPIEGIYPQTVLFAVLSLLLLDDAGEGSRLASARRLGALVAAVGAGFACAIGLILWPILLWAAWRGRLGWRWMTAIAVLGGGFVAPLPARRRPRARGR
jgi:hypothetical protein